MQLEIWKISGQSFHFGQHGLGQEETSASFPSDSLFSALVARLAGLEGAAAVEAFMHPFLQGSPPFLLTSTFPYAGQVYFFPNPAYQPPKELAAKTPAPVRPKELKRVQWISEAVFRRILKGERLQELYPQARSLQGKSCLIAPEELQGLPPHLQAAGARLWQIDRRPRVTLGRGGQNSSLFFTGRLSFAEACGLWVGIHWLVDDPRLHELVSLLLADLAIAGLGGERSAGFGSCTIQPQQEGMELPDARGRRWINLSRYHPRPDETGALQDPAASYKIATAGGWLDSPARRGQRRRSIRLICEGSILGPLARPAPGKVVDVRPVYAGDADPLGHPVYRSGLAVGVGILAGGEGEPQ